MGRRAKSTLYVIIKHCFIGIDVEIATLLIILHIPIISCMSCKPFCEISIRRIVANHCFDLNQVSEKRQSSDFSIIHFPNNAVIPTIFWIISRKPLNENSLCHSKALFWLKSCIDEAKIFTFLILHFPTNADTPITKLITS